jgi:FAD/FMN-containing dehydrogenase
VIEFELLLATGELIRCSKEENPELFTATFGAMGLTGIVTTVALRLEKVETAYIRQKTIKAENLAEVMRAFESTSDWTYSVAWIDCLAKGDGIGRSILTIGEHAGIKEVPQSVNVNPLYLKKKIKLNVPFHFPSFLLNSFTVKLFNKLYYWKSNQGDTLVPYDSFFYPLDSVLNWNRIYGKRGFTQYQCVIPMQNSEAALKELLQKIADSGLASFLAVLKLFGKQEGLLSFPTEGYTLALDFPMSSASLSLLDDLDEIVKKYEGRLYLTKDVRMSAEFFHSSYDKDSLERFNKLRIELDPDKKINSLQSQRLGL